METEYYGYIYITIDQKKNKVYVGQKKGKIEDSEDYFGSGKIIQAIIKKRGTYFLKKTILGVCYSKEELTFWETECKYFFNAFDKKYGYNIAIKDDGGNNWTYHPNKIKWRRLISLKSRLVKNKLSYDDKILLELFLNDKNDIELLNYELWKEQKKLEKQINKEINSTYECRSKKTIDAWNRKSQEEKDIFINKMIDVNNSDEHKNKSKKSRQGKEYKENMSRKMTEHSNKKEIKEKRSKEAEESWKDEDIRNNRQQSLKNTYATTNLASRHSNSMKSDKRKLMDKDIENFINKFILFTIYDLMEYYNCSKDISQKFILDLLSQNKLNKIGRIKGNKGKIYYEFCKN